MMLRGNHTLEEIVSEKVVDPMDALISRQIKRQNFIIGYTKVCRLFVFIKNGQDTSFYIEVCL